MESALCSAEECYHRELHRRLDRCLCALAAGGALLHAGHKHGNQPGSGKSCPCWMGMKLSQHHIQEMPISVFPSDRRPSSQVYELMGFAGLSEYIWLGGALSVALTITLQELGRASRLVQIPSTPFQMSGKIGSPQYFTTKLEELQMFIMAV